VKKQKGFTLVELLIVIAIMGILLTIAIPYFLNQRPRARDRVATHNMTSRISDLQGQYDLLRETGEYTDAEIASELGKYLQSTTSSKDKNPWTGTGNATTASVFDYTIAITGTAHSTVTDFEGALEGYGTVLGRPQFAIQFASAGNPGFLGGAVLLQATDKDKKPIRVYKIVALE